jgi:glycosyltransferase involved in cell wall biosynthesis
MPFKIQDKIVNKHLLHYVPHGIDSNMFKPMEADDKAVKAMRKSLFGDKVYDFVLFHNSRNIQRKKTSNTILAFRAFCDNLPKEKADKCALILHTETSQDAGTDLLAVINALCPTYHVIVHDVKVSPQDMCILYNIADATILISSNEGFGLSIAESIMCGTPVIVNVTGGLQDQIGQMDDAGNPVKFSAEFGTNSTKKYTKHGVWAKPVWPAVRTIQGSPPTPYIFDDICTWEETAEAIMYWYLTDSDTRIKAGLEGRRWACAEGGLNAKNMCTQFMAAMDFTLANFHPPSAFDIHSPTEFIAHKQPNENIGVSIPAINVDKIKADIEQQFNKACVV